tara:strand:- start:1647 stop:2093 length:447 start_codon:yes stop_codon:yes gene_type:complete
MKTLLIAHRGNTLGPDKDNENSPGYISEALKKGFDCEVDLRLDQSSEDFYLGHDEKQYQISMDWLIENKENLWIHCKDFFSLNKLNSVDLDLNYFWHENDRFTLTSKGYIWTYPDNLISKNSVIVSLDDSMPDEECYGICSDYVEKFK